MDELFKTVRGACSAMVWSRGVELSRNECVIAEAISPTEAVLRVTTPLRPVSATVKLWPEEEDWLCDCGAEVGPCEHVVAAVITLRRAKEAGKSLPISSTPRGIVQYRFSREDGALALQRWIVGEGIQAALSGPLSALLSGRVPGPAVSASKQDMTADRALAETRSAKPLAPCLAELLRILRESEHIVLDGVKIAVGEPVAPVRAIVTDEEDALRIFVEPSPEIEESFHNGAALSNGALCPLAVPEYAGLEKEIVSRGRLFPRAQWGELASRVLPDLEKKIPVVVRTQRLPKVEEGVRPRLLFQTSARGEVLSVLPLVVYGDPPLARVDGGRLAALGDMAVLPERSLTAEARLTAQLQSEFGFSVGRRVEFRGDAAIRFVEKLRGWKGGQVAGNGINYFGLQPPLMPNLSFEGERLRVEFRAAGGAGSVEARQVLNAWRDGQERVPLLNGEGWAPLPTDWLSRFGDRLLDLLAARTQDGEIPKYARPETARLCEELNTACPPAFAKLRDQLEGFHGITSVRLPSDLVAELRPYQKRGVDWLRFLAGNEMGALLADDMGLGKTLQTLCAIQGRALVVVPTSVLPNWQKEIARFRPGLTVSVYHGPDRALDRKAAVTLTTYAILRLDIDRLEKENWETAVLDEAQNIKNPESQVAQAAYRLRAKFRLALTGTPVENRLEDLWSLLHFLNPGLLGGRAHFNERYAQATLAADPVRAEALRTRIKPFLLRRLKQEVAPELPPRTELVLYCDSEPAEREIYEMVRIAARGEVLEALAHQGGVMAALECLLRLRQASCHPSLVPGQSAEDSSKVRLLREKLEEVAGEGHKALVFSQWTSLLDLIEPGLKRSGLEFLRIDGSTRDRGTVVERFQSDSGPPCLLMTLKSGGVGLNLTAADHVFLVDPWWNPAAEDQAADRAHRIGQDRPVFIHRLVARETVEEKILALQERKRQAAAIALGGASHGGAITREELLALLV